MAVPEVGFFGSVADHGFVVSVKMRVIVYFEERRREGRGDLDTTWGVSVNHHNVA